MVPTLTHNEVLSMRNSKWFILFPSIIVICLLLTGHVDGQSTALSCPSGWTLHEGRCYLPVTHSQPWKNALQTCESFGARLVEPLGFDFNQYIGNTLINLPEYWIGFNRVNVTSTDPLIGSWSGGQAAHAEVGIWSLAQPNPDLGKCVYAKESVGGIFEWSYEKCERQLPYICQTLPCPTDTFRCFNGRCLSSAKVCNDFEDCQDGSDESNCPSNCFFKITGTGGTVSSPNSPNVYDLSKTCQWIIEGPIGTKIQAELSSFTTEKDVDFLDIWGGSSSLSLSRHLARLSGSFQDNAHRFTSSDNFMIIRFSSDDSVMFPGFILQWTADVNIFPISGGVLDATFAEQILQSPMHPAKYPGGIQSTYVIRTSGMLIITLNVIDVDLPPGDQDYIIIRDGGSASSPLLMKIEYGHYPKVIMSTQRELYVFIYLSTSQGGRGIIMSYKAGCDFTIDADHGEIFSPAYGVRPYPNIVSCTWQITSSSQRGLSIVFDDNFFLEDKMDYLQVFSGDSDQAPALHAGNGFTGSVAPLSTYSASGRFFVRFKTGALNSDVGFKAFFSSDCVSPTVNAETLVSPTPLKGRFQTAAIVVCAANHKFSQKQFHSDATLSVVCEIGGKWNIEPFPSCIPIYCGRVSFVANGYVISSSGVDAGDTVSYGCDVGYTLNGPSTVTCQPTGDWEAAPTCSSVQCPEFSTVSGGLVTAIVGDGRQHGSVISITCNQGYQLHGLPSLMCSNGAWSNKLPVCQIAPCTDQVTANAAANPSPPYNYGDTITVTCNQGYRRQGDAQYICGQTPPPSCVNINECSEKTAGCEQICDDTSGGYSCSCNQGYRQDPSDTHICLEIDECAVSNGHCGQTCVNSPGGYECTCSNGYQLYAYSGMNDIQLPGVETGLKFWDILYFNHSCVKVQCTLPASINSGLILNAQTGYYYEDTVTYYCNLGYAMTGTDVITCLADGAWSGSAPACSPATCPPVVIPAGVANPPVLSKQGSLAYREQIALTCSVPGRDDVTSDRQCLYDRVTQSYTTLGHWLECPETVIQTPWSEWVDSPGYDGDGLTFSFVYWGLDRGPCWLVCSYFNTMTTDQTMQVIDCWVPTHVPGSQPYSVTCTKYECQFTFNCYATTFMRIGASSAGDNIVRCGVDGRWDFGDLACSGPTCTDPGLTLETSQMATSYDEGSLISFACSRPGYLPSHQNQLQCVYDTNTQTLSWNGTVPTCSDVTPPSFLNCPSTVYVPKFKSPIYIIPTPNDNGGLVASLTVSPENFSPYQLIEADTLVNYTATDFAGNTASCYFHVKISDNAPPAISCVGSEVHDITSEDQQIVIDTRRFVTIDSSTLDVSVTMNIDTLILDRLSIGETIVIEATATSAAGNSASCKTFVSVNVGACRPWNLKIPNADFTCTETNNRYACTVTCQLGYSFYDNPEIRSKVVECDSITDPSWTTNLPECVQEHHSVHTIQFQLFYYIGATSLTTCAEAYAVELRSRIPTLISSLTNVCRDILLEFSLQEADTITVGVTTAKGGDQRVYATIELYLLPRGYRDALFSTCASRLQSRFQALSFEFQSIKSVSVSNGCPSGTATYSSSSYTVSCHTDIEELRNITTIGMSVCLVCPLGQYVSALGVCTSCSSGWYRADVNLAVCSACPLGSRSTATGGDSIGDCYVTCPDGMRSPSGSQPCLYCGQNTYSVSTTICQACPAGTGTTGARQGSFADCLTSCTSGHYSRTGLFPCSPCPTGFYQDQTGQTTCKRCPSALSTQPGASPATSVSQCIAPGTVLCTPGLCLNGGVCGVVRNAFHCACPPGYTGLTCGTEINPCLSGPCYNGGVCMKLSATQYSCQCYSSASGDRCQILPNNCLNTDCLNNGVCQNRLGGSTCLCPLYTGFSGNSCFITRNPCSELVCFNGGMCVTAGNTRRICQCPVGYTGDSCEINIDECVSSPCLHDGVCRDGVNSFNCDCPLGYSGTYCEMRDDVCSMGTLNTCTTFGTCVDDYGRGSIMCQCQSSYDDVNGVCTQHNYCSPDPCQNGATCYPGITSYTCVCVVGYQGDQCQHQIDLCLSSPCKHLGVCVSEVNAYSCICASHTIGPNCEDKNDCKPLPCVVNRFLVCTDLHEDYDCQCREGYSGKNCQDDVNDCTSLSCNHGGQCVDLFNSFRCDCPSGWSGDQCDVVIDQCTPSSCNTNGQCVNTVTDFACICNPGYRGDRCETVYNICDVAAHCFGTSQCINDENVAKCNCAAGFSGDGCQTRDSECSSTTCQNAGICSKVGGVIECACPTGFSGDRCEINDNNCAAAVCPTNSRCIDGINTFTCQCQIGKVGDQCDKDFTDQYNLILHQGTETPTSVGQIMPLGWNQMTASVWMKYSKVNGRGTVFSLYGLQSDDSFAGMTDILTIDATGASTKLTGTQESLSVDQSSSISDGNWHHVTVTWNGLTGDLVAYVDGNAIGTVQNYGTDSQLDPFGLLVIGRTYDGTGDRFEGEISRLKLYPRVLTASEIDRLHTKPNDNLPADDNPDIVLSAIKDSDIIIDYESQVTGSECTVPAKCQTLDERATHPVVTTCPPDSAVTTSRVSTLSVTPATFDNSATVTTEPADGMAVGWGTYVVTSVGRESDGDAAVCTYRIFTTRTSCEQPPPPIGGTQTCTTHPDGISCTVQCSTYQHQPAMPSPVVYTCNTYTPWQPGQTDGPFRYPACTASTRRMVNMLVRVTYPIKSCANPVVPALQSRLREGFRALNVAWDSNLCNQVNCDHIPVFVNCSLVTRRRKRQATLIGVGIEARFDKINDPILSANAESLNPDKVMAREFVDTSNFNEPSIVGGFPDVTSLDIQLIPYCPPGWQIIGDFCVECGAGTYYDANTAKCFECPKGEYQTLSAQTSCTPCPSGTTPNTGAQSSTECYIICMPGFYLDIATRTCVACPVGFYQSSQGTFYCMPCGITQTNTGVGMTSSTSCIVDGATVTPDITTGTGATGDPTIGAITSAGLSGVEIGAIVLAIVILFLLILLLIVCCCRECCFACCPCCRSKAQVVPEDKEKYQEEWNYVNRYGETNMKFVSYKLNDIRDRTMKKSMVSKSMDDRQLLYRKDTNGSDSGSLEHNGSIARGTARKEVTMQVPMFNESLHRPVHKKLEFRQVLERDTTATTGQELMNTDDIDMAQIKKSRHRKKKGKRSKPKPLPPLPEHLRDSGNHDPLTDDETIEKGLQQMPESNGALPQESRKTKPKSKVDVTTLSYSEFARNPHVERIVMDSDEDYR